MSNRYNRDEVRLQSEFDDGRPAVSPLAHPFMGLLTVLVVGYLLASTFVRDGVNEPTNSIQTSLGETMLNLRTPGGLLEVHAFRMSEQLDNRIKYAPLGLEIGETVSHVSFNAFYRYHIELAKSWPIHVRSNVVTVVAPQFQASVPVAFDSATLQEDVGGSWLLVALFSDEDIDVLRRQITSALEAKAASSLYRTLAREDARKTVVEYVTKLLREQTRYGDVPNLRVQVTFEDEVGLDLVNRRQ